MPGPPGSRLNPPNQHGEETEGLPRAVGDGRGTPEGDAVREQSHCDWWWKRVVSQGPGGEHVTLWRGAFAAAWARVGEMGALGASGHTWASFEGK